MLDGARYYWRCRECKVGWVARPLRLAVATDEAID